MTNREKAEAFLIAFEHKDDRCNLLLMMLLIAVGISQDECLRKIKLLADTGWQQ